MKSSAFERAVCGRWCTRLAGAFAAAVLTIAGPCSVLADAVYTYIGNPLFNITDGLIPNSYTTQDRLSGSFTLAAPLGPSFTFADITSSLLSISFTDGRFTYNNPHPFQGNAGPGNVVQFSFATGPSGNITDWAVELVANLLSSDGSYFDQAIYLSQGFTTAPVNPTHLNTTADQASVNRCFFVPDGTCTSSVTYQDFAGGVVFQVNLANWSESTLAVPGPIAGAGLPGLIFATVGLLGWRRRRQKA